MLIFYEKMSIHHRYALLYNMQRYQADVKKLAHLVSQCRVVETIAEDNNMTNDLPTGEDTTKSLDQDQESSALRDKEKEDGGKQWNRGTPGNDKDKDNDSPQGRHEVSADAEDGNAPNDQLEGQNKPEHENDAKSDETQDHAETMFFTTAPRAPTELSVSQPPPGDCPQHKITRSQLNQMLACDRVLDRIKAGLVKNIHRIKADENELFSQTIQHLWNEAARLNGTEKIKTLRVIDRELKAGNWWEGGKASGDSSGSQDGKQNAAGSIAGASLRLPCSPLQNLVKPGDLLWDDEVQQWRLNMGRLMDGKGRRCVKL